MIYGPDYEWSSGYRHEVAVQVLELRSRGYGADGRTGVTWEHTIGECVSCDAMRIVEGMRVWSQRS